MQSVGSGKGGKAIFSEINITPLTDIFLVLLIIMMVVAPMMDQMRADIKPPDLTSGSDVKAGQMTVEITKDGEYFVLGKETAVENLSAVLNEHKGEVEEKNVIIRADKTTRSSAVMKVLEAARDAKYEKVTIAGAPLSGKRQEELGHSSAALPAASQGNLE